MDVRANNWIKLVVQSVRVVQDWSVVCLVSVKQRQVLRRVLQMDLLVVGLRTVVAVYVINFRFVRQIVAAAVRVVDAQVAQR